MRKGQTIISCEECRSRNSSLFNVLCGKQLAEVSQNKSCTIYKKGQILFHEGTRPLGVFCVNQGKIKVYKLGFDGKEQIVNIIGEGGLLGYKAMLAEEPYSVSAETLEDCTICFLSKPNFLQTLSDSSDLNKRLMKQLCHEYGVMNENLTNQAQRTVRERLAITLLKLKDTYGLDYHENGPVEINLTREDLANIVGTATETLIRLLHEFKEDKLISTKGRKITIDNPAGLMKTANVY
ncbi:Crp/Fnr family transcriptional regulator [Catalinimonas niigatensis]|uniref:Crp/Fnr family transcriptional regulator n=1 Tax=Catalinimonas niigatensis TaxID=1397264 RepID=UPI00266716D1|nr:Crp/Fnr family transcriptional regulator [Catalinimonas niigatensis]WPP52082.1 Crp/Fnr family transcriptional regulator [Catalinimonas niigatensis]